MIWDFHGWLFWTLLLCCAVVVALYGWALLRFAITWPEVVVHWIALRLRTWHGERQLNKLYRQYAKECGFGTLRGYPYESRLRDKMEADNKP